MSLSELGTQYITITEEIKEHNAKIKEKKEKKKQLMEQIIEKMVSSNTPELILSCGTIVCEKKSKPETLNKKNIKDSLLEYCGGNSVEADKIAGVVMANRPKKEKNNLKIKA